MNYIIEISLSVIMILFVLLGLIKISIFKKNTYTLPSILISLLLLGFGLYLSIKYGLVLDYGTEDEIKCTHAELMYFFAITSVLTGLSFILISIIKFIIWKIKTSLNRK
ncbi:MAG: hypothetical protein PHP52_09845 [Bacteroidales bacterium]|nr:hypothetical protein [Bacteroidales bacterium]MDD4216407.1 hypothetical protein [Bacteroidales bacterium]